MMINRIYSGKTFAAAGKASAKDLHCSTHREVAEQGEKAPVLTKKRPLLGNWRRVGIECWPHLAFSFT